MIDPAEVQWEGGSSAIPESEVQWEGSSPSLSIPESLGRGARYGLDKVTHAVVSPVASMLGYGDRSQEMGRRLDASRAAASEAGGWGTAGQIGTEALLAAPVAFAAGPGFLPQVAAGAATAGAFEPGNLAERAKAAAWGGAGAGAGYGVGRALGGMTGAMRSATPLAAASYPGVGRQAAKMMERGIQPTVGQAANPENVVGGALRSIEDVMAGRAWGTNAARDRASREWTETLLQRVAPPGVGRVGKATIQGEPEQVMQGLLGAYDDAFTQVWGAIPQINIPRNFVNQIPQVMNAAGARTEYTNAVMRAVGNRWHGGPLTGRMAQAMRSDLSELAMKLERVDPMAADGVRSVEQALIRYAEQSAPPQWAQAMRELNGQYSKFLRFGRAMEASRKSGQPFAPSQLQAAVHSMDPSAHKMGLVSERAPLAAEANMARDVLTPARELDPTRAMATGGGIAAAGTAAYMAGVPVPALGAAVLGAQPIAKTLATRTGQGALTGNLPGQAKFEELGKFLGPIIAARTGANR